MNDLSRSFLTVPQAADRVGVGPATIRQWIHRGHLTALRVNRRVYIRELDLLKAERATRHRAGTRRPTLMPE
ncbi:helix-turn-helix domain-containing protein [Thermomonospora umbrina]|uniref:Excisionase family DNA binding protein n=1 Tax=Thermomonospora umbrina TaxID=111806 RepID=A0A3D9SQD2_9ACTN|nr:helix-turn-helix domain-containing protein [Thermomonospora umbrina]REE95155.1 excisionase family DNA binding protein [Thermomonospora umbrina]